MKNFYLKNYRAIHHLATIVEFYFISRIFNIESINTYTVGNLPIQLGGLLLCFIVTKYSLRKSGIDDYVKSELDKLNSKDL
jgi:hypothetical protein